MSGQDKVPRPCSESASTFPILGLVTTLRLIYLLARVAGRVLVTAGVFGVDAPVRESFA